MNAKIKRKIIAHLANIIGWKTNRKIVVILSDDWGSIHTPSKEVREKLTQSGLDFQKDRFDYYDALEDDKDLTNLFEVLSSVKDKNGHPAVFTPYSVVTNPDFESIQSNNYSEYIYETLPVTYQKLPGYEKVWDLWKQGINEGIFIPQFHGREHLNVRIMMDGLRKGDNQMLESLKYKSWAGIQGHPNYLATYSFRTKEENEWHKENLKDGLNLFEKLFGYKARFFVPPQGKYNRILEPSLKKEGIDFIDVPRIKYEPQLDGSSKKVYTYLGKKNKLNQKYIVRNAMFENTKAVGLDWVDFCLYSIDAAFNLRAPAVITTHRVNFVGHVVPSNRDKGLKDLKKLLQTITGKWPDVEFMSLEKLGNLMDNKK